MEDCISVCIDRPGFSKLCTTDIWGQKLLCYVSLSVALQVI